jgi:energy-converting hydrogenase Eha subunit H
MPATGLESRGTGHEMEILVWAGMFLMLAVAGSLVALFSMVGMPIGSDLQTALLVLAALVGGTGMAVFLAAPTLTPRQNVDWLKRTRQ